MTPKDFPAFYFAGIAVLAVKFGIEVRRLSVGDDVGLKGEALLEPVKDWCSLNVGTNVFKAMQVEDYVTALLGGSAASYVQAQTERCPLKRSMGDAGLELNFLRDVWQCLQCEPDRAVAIICGSLGAFDDGDVEATTQRLWRRAVRLLQEPPLHEQLRRLARLLKDSGKLSGNQVLHLLKSK